MIINKFNPSFINNNILKDISKEILLDLPEGFSSGAGTVLDGRNQLRTVLSAYVHTGQWELVDNLLTAEIDIINSKDGDGRTVLHEIAAIGTPQAVIELVKRGANLNAEDNEKRTPLHYAVSKKAKQIAVVEQLITSGANVNTADNKDRTVVHYTAAHGHASVLECLAKHQANLGSVDKRGQTPLQLAVQDKNLDVVDAIIAIMKQQAPEKHTHLTQLPRSFYASRRLYFVFGGEKLKTVMTNINHQSNGGLIDESLSFLVTCLASFIAEKKPDHRDKFEIILNTLKSCLENNKTSTTDLATQVSEGIPVLMHSGYIGHALMALFYRQNDKYFLSIMDRGALSKLIPNTDNCHSIRRIEIPKHLLIWIISEIKKFKLTDKHGDSINKFLFTKLPRIVQSDYQSDDELQQKLSKDVLCYFHAVKSALLELFVMQFGKEQGHNIYKELFIYAREKTLESYQINVSKDYEPNREQVVEECNRIIEHKRAKFV